MESNAPARTVAKTLQRSDSSKADRLHQQSAQAEDTPSIEEARKAVSETKSMKEQAESQANKALGAGRSLGKE